MTAAIGPKAALVAVCAAALAGAGAYGDEEPSPPAAPVVAPPAREDVTSAQIDTLLAAWRSAENAVARHRAEDEIVALGAPAVERLLDFAGAPRVSRDAWDRLIRKVGPAAIAPVLARLARAEGDARGEIIRVLESMLTVWRDDPQGADVCRALVALLGDDRVGDKAVELLRQSRPAGRAVAVDLAELWLHGTGAAASRAGELLQSLGPDAAPAARLMLAELAAEPPPRLAPKAPASEPGGGKVATEGEAAAPVEARKLRGPSHEQRCRIACAVLGAVGAQDPSLLDDLRKLLAADRSPVVRAGAVQILRTWGDAAAPAAGELVAMLGDADEQVRWAAASVLSGMPTQKDAVWDAFLAAFQRGDAWARRAGPAQRLVSSEASTAARFAALVPSLPPAEMVTAFESLSHGGGFDVSSLAPMLLRQTDPAARRAALACWIGGDDKRPVPDGAARFLEDPDPSVRAEAARLLAGRQGVPAAKVRVAALPRLQHAAPAERITAVRSLGRIAAGDAASRDAVLGVLGADADDDVRWEAFDVIARDDAPIHGEHAAAVAWIAAEFVEHASDRYGHWRHKAMPRFLLRLPGGADALTAAIETVLAADKLPQQVYFTLDAVRVLGPRAAPLRETLVRLRKEQDGESELRRKFVAAVAVIDGDPEAIAMNARPDDDSLELLLAMGPSARSAIMLLAGDGGIYRWENAVAEIAPLSDAIVAAARSPETDGISNLRRVGAARLARWLPPAQAVDVWTFLVDGADSRAFGTLREGTRPELAGRLRWVITEGATALETRSPGAVPVALARKLMGDLATGRQDLGLLTALGARASEFVPDLRRIRDTGARGADVTAAVALWRITRRADEALPKLRTFLGSRHLEDEAAGVPWDDLGEVMAEMPLERADLDAILAALRKRLLAPATSALVPLLEKFGADAAPAVPALRRVLMWPTFPTIESRDPWGSTDPRERAVAAAIRTLGAIGPAARDTLPDLQVWLVRWGDPRGHVRDTIRRIEAAK